MSDVMGFRQSAMSVVTAVLLSTQPALAEGHTGAWSPEICLQGADAAFEHSLNDDVEAADRTALENVFEIATFECLGLSMEICEGQEDGVPCLSDLAAWVRDARAGIVARLPEALAAENDATAERFGLLRERAGAPAVEADCDHMSEDARARYCEVVSEGGALEDAYDAWRLARRVGAAPLEGHDPINLEWIR